MKKSLLKKAIFLNIITVMVLFIFLVTVSFAWFTFDDFVNVEQTLITGVFKVNLNDKDGSVGEFETGSNVFFGGAYPITDELGRTFSDSVQSNRYVFKVENGGTVKAMYRFFVNITDTTLVSESETANIPSLAESIKYDIKVSTSEGDLSTATWIYESGAQYLVDSTVNSTSNMSLQETLDFLTIDTTDPTALKGKTDTSGGYGILESSTSDYGEVFFYEIRVWLADTATVDVCGKRLVFSLGLKAMQADGGASWNSIPYNITYKDEGGISFSGQHGTDAPTSISWTSGTTLVAPTKSGYTFEGWYLDKACSGTAVTELEANKYAKNVILYAKWSVT